MIKLNIKVNAKFINKWPNKVIVGAKQGLTTYLKNLTTYSKNVFGMPDALVSRTGNLKNSIKKSIVKQTDEDSIEGTVGSNVIYAPVHEFGATITRRSGKQFTIPKRPFLKRALDMTVRTNEGINTIQQAIIKELNK